ncbi:MAG: hypothetical protein K1W06_11350 [Lachnospiraceae bacterium]
MKLNNEVYKMEKDNLVYDMSHPLDAKNITIALEGEGVVKRGQVICYADGAYTLHSAGGVAAGIVAEDTPYTAEDTEITVPVYISGTFRTSACISGVELTMADIENLRSKGIYLK